MKSLHERLIESLNEAKVTFGAYDDIDALAAGCPANSKSLWGGKKIQDEIKNILDMGYKSISQGVFHDPSPAYFYVFSKNGSKTDMVLTTIFPPKRWGQNDYVIVSYTTKRDLISDYVIRLDWGHSKGKRSFVQCCYPEWLEECDFGEYNDIVKKATWYCNGKGWVTNDNYHAYSFYEKDKK